MSFLLSWSLPWVLKKLLPMRRLISRRGMPAVLMSDNAKGLKAAAAKKVRVLRSEGPKWKFIPPRAAWHGGYREHMVQNIKNSLKNSVGKRILTRAELETVLFDIEGILNSRTLTFVGDDLDTGVLLTPSHFLIDLSCRNALWMTKVPEISPEDMVLPMEYLMILPPMILHLMIHSMTRRPMTGFPRPSLEKFNDFSMIFQVKNPKFHNSERYKTEKHRTTCYAWSPHTSYHHYWMFSRKSAKSSYLIWWIIFQQIMYTSNIMYNNII